MYQIEMVQRKATRFVFNDYSRHSSVTDMLNKLNWQSLEKWRNDLTLLVFYKIINQYVDVPQRRIQDFIGEEASQAEMSDVQS